ncbi:MAG TPA: hypothetical protein VJ505_06080 [Holophagaceae bacterium]|nr:hypothetical protein [Holophagaceae bacterium]
MRFLIPILLTSTLGAWSPRMHETQSVKALRMIPRPMAAFLRAHQDAFLEGARGVASYEPPTAESVAAQYRTVVRMSEERRSADDIARDLGILARMVQALHDPSCRLGLDPLRLHFEAYADQNLHHLLVTSEPFWSLKADLDPTPRIVAWQDQKLERHQRLLGHFDLQKGKPLGPWDDLSVPFAQLQLSFSNGIHATANLWILLWRNCGDAWVPPAS